MNGETEPALLPLKEINGLCFLSHPENAQQIHNCMQTIALRILLSLPPGLCKFTLYDGTNLGANLIALSSLSPKIKGENILTDPEELRRALISIKTDIPNIIQKVLGHRYLGKSLIEYNADADEFWYAPGSLKHGLDTTSANVLRAEVRNVLPEEDRPFTQWTSVVYHVPNPQDYDLSTYSIYGKDMVKVIDRKRTRLNCRHDMI